MSNSITGLRSLCSDAPAKNAVKSVSLVVSATAGSGKTTTSLDAINNLFSPVKNERHTAEQKAILAWVKKAWAKVPAQSRTPDGVQFLAFNKSIATELQKKLVNGQASTIHSFGSKLVWAFFPRTLGAPRPSVKMDNYKTSNLYQQYCAADSWKDLSKEQRALLDDLKTVVSTAKDHVKTEFDFLPIVNANGNVNDPSYSSELLRNPSKLDRFIASHDEVLEAFDHFLCEANIEVDSDPSALLAPFLYVLHASTWHKEFDFDDMIYLPNRFGWVSQYPLSLIVVDEAQDLSIGKQRLICSQPCHIRVFIGDRNQAIYGFAGADCRSMDTIKTMTEADELPLTYSFRCASSVVEFAAQFVPQGSIQPAPNAPTGKVLTCEAEALLSTDPANAFALRPNDLVICRTNMPIMSLAWKLLKAGRPAVLIGGNLGRSLKAMVKKHSPQGDRTTIPEFLDKLEAWVKRAIEQMESWKSDTTERQIALADQRDSLRELSIGCSDVCELQSRLDKLFSTEAKANAIRLSSIHRAKGLEARNVFWLRPELCPHPMAKTAEARLQEKNLQFVAASRAIETLVLARVSVSGDSPE